MKKLLLISLCLTLCAVSYSEFDTSQAQKVGIEILTQSSDVANALAPELNKVDFGQATELKDSVIAVLQSAPNDPKANEIKDRAIHLVELGIEAQNNPHAIGPIIVSLITLISLLIGYFVSHFGVFGKKKKEGF